MDIISAPTDIISGTSELQQQRRHPRGRGLRSAPDARSGARVPVVEYLTAHART